MHWTKVLVALAGAACLQVCGIAAEHGGHAPAAAEQGLPSAAPRIFSIGPLPITNSMILTWVVALVLILAVRIGVREIREVPDGA